MKHRLLSFLSIIMYRQSKSKVVNREWRVGNRKWQLVLTPSVRNGPGLSAQRGYRAN